MVTFHTDQVIKITKCLLFEYLREASPKYMYQLEIAKNGIITN